MECKIGGSFISRSFRFTLIAQQRYKTERSGFSHSSHVLKWFYPSSYIFVHLPHIFEISASWPMSQYTQSSARVLATLLCDQSKLPTRGQNHTVHCRWSSTLTFCRQRNKLQKLYFTQLIVQVQCFCYVWDQCNDFQKRIKSLICTSPLRAASQYFEHPSPINVKIQ